MGIISDLYDLIRDEDSLFPAMEAEDITTDARAAANAATGNEDENSGDINLNTDDILAPEDEQKEDDNTDDTSSDETGEGEEPPVEDAADDAMQESDDPFSASRKKKLWKQLKALYTTLEDSVMLITKYVPNISDAPTIKTMNTIKENLLTSKELIFRTLTQEYHSLSYPEMQKRYIGLSHIYDLCTKELDLYFKKYRTEE